jgi:D-arabinose 1-dehydrogenase-like Zn-dependent alcohol dehydrogenase
VTAPEPEQLVELDILAEAPACGSAVARAGDRRVLVGPSDACGQCEVCRRGGAAVCPHARPRGVRVSTRWLVTLDGELELPVPAAAAVAGDITTAYTLYARTGLAPRDPVAITGATAVARFLVQILRAKGITPVVVGGTWASWVTSVGALHAASTADVAPALATLGLGVRPVRVIATDPAAIADAAALAGPRATLTVLGAPVSVPGELLGREVTIIGVAGPHPDLVTEAAAMCAKREIDLADGVTGDPADRTRTLVR